MEGLGVAGAEGRVGGEAWWWSGGRRGAEQLRRVVCSVCMV